MNFTIIIDDDTTIEGFKKKVRDNPSLRAAPMKYGKEIGQPIIFDVILDISGSMELFYDELVDCFNDILIPSLKEAGERYKGSTRVGCLLFSEKLIPAWYGYKDLADLGKKPLKKAMLEQDGLRGYTALYGAMRTGILWTAATMEYMHKNGRGEMPKGKIIVLSDGANNREPRETASVIKSINSIDKLYAKNLQRVIGFFNTDDGLTRDQFNVMAKETGFEGLGFYEIAKGVSDKEKRASFRHHFKIFSSQAAR